MRVKASDRYLLNLRFAYDAYNAEHRAADAPHTGCYEQTKDKFLNLLDEMTAKVPLQEAIVVAGDPNGHMSATKDGYSCHGGFGYGSRNTDGERILEYADSHNLAIVKRHRDQGHVTDVKTAPYETVPTQHRPLICTLNMAWPRPKLAERCGPARIKWGRLKEKEAAVVSSILLPAVMTVDETWKGAAEAITQVARSKPVMTKRGRRKLDKQTWLWTEHVRDKVRE
uniref:Endo/exonuclease/phosphatase domain-containing protein n=1 Tax=Haemonchus contortus TaxID=6289 RepID=A0A7I4YXS4_HAECO